MPLTNIEEALELSKISVLSNLNKWDVVNEVHKHARKNSERRRVTVKGIDDFWQANLVEIMAYESFNTIYRYLLTVINTFSKKAWVEGNKIKLL